MISVSKKTVPVLLSLSPTLPVSLHPSLMFNLLPSQLHPPGFPFNIFSGFFATFIMLSSNNR